MSERHVYVCPAVFAGSLDNVVRRWLQNPRRFLKPYVREGVRAIDFGCGPGFFTIPLAELVGASGRVTAIDLQPEMLEKLREQLSATGFLDRVRIVQGDTSCLRDAGPVDFVLAFYVLHEIPDRETFFGEVRKILSTGGSILVVAPPLHVSRRAFKETLEIARASGYAIVARPRSVFNQCALLRVATP